MSGRESTSSSNNGNPPILMNDDLFNDDSTIDNDSFMGEDDGYDSDEFYGRDVPNGPVITFEDDAEDRINPPNTKVKPDDWDDLLISSVGQSCTLEMDQAAEESWHNCVLEVNHIQKRVKSLLQFNSDDKVKLKDLVHLCFGEQSEFYRSFWENELNFKRGQFAKFFGTMALQMSYKETSDALFDECSELKDSVLIEKSEYNAIWKKIANLKRIPLDNFVGASRRPQCLWEMTQNAVNDFLQKIIIDGRDDEICIATDDDKVWIESSGKNMNDHFGIRKTTHVKDNRKGFTDHASATMPLIFPMQFIFEMEGDNAIKCFKKLYSLMFGTNKIDEIPDLTGVYNLSDRGYTIEETIFEYLIPAGASFLHTAKRVSPFPFIWGKRPGRADRRTYLSETGTPALFIKNVHRGGRRVSLFAFRTGTGNISAIVTNTMHQHEWEGITLNPEHKTLWTADKRNGLNHLHFPCMARSPELAGMYHQDMVDFLQKLREEKIDVITLEQGTADWHRARQFSLTSSQSDGSFQKAMIIYQDDEDFRKVAKYLEGENYYRCKFCDKK